MSDETDLRSDPLFGGLTRPATIMGLPIEAAVIIAGGSTVLFLMGFIFDVPFFWKAFPLGLGLVLYSIARLLCAKDPRAFRYLGLSLETKAMHRTRQRWGCGSYSPLLCRKRS
jgi:type IV secretory pathway VirB3-like protein